MKKKKNVEELWRGNVVPYGSVRHTPEMTQLMGYIARHHEKLTANLTGELKETFEKLDDCWNEYAELCDKEVFIHAFRLGITALTPNANSGQNGIPPSPNRKPADDGYDQFVQLIEAIRNSHNITKDYIKSDDGKCVALYKKWAGKELTVAFSGHRDCIDDNLYTFFGVLKQGNKKYRDYEKIAKAIGANLAGTTYFVSRYDFSHPDIRHDLIKDIMHRGRTAADYKSNVRACSRRNSRRKSTSGNFKSG